MSCMFGHSSAVKTACIFIIDISILNNIPSTVNPKHTSVLGIDNLRKSIINYYLEEYFGIDIQMKVLDFEF